MSFAGLKKPDDTPLKVVVFEITLVQDFTEIGGVKGEFAVHKSEQIFWTSQILTEKYGPDVPIEYHLIGRFNNGESNTHCNYLCKWGSYFLSGRKCYPERERNGQRHLSVAHQRNQY